MLSNKRPIEASLSLDVRRLWRDGLLRPGRTFTWVWSCGGEWLASVGVEVETGTISLMYRWQPCRASEWRPARQRVPLAWTKCHLGGARCWFVCPQETGEGKRCGRRCAKLYLGDSPIFGCRLCHHLIYASQLQTPRDRAIAKARRSALASAYRFGHRPVRKRRRFVPTGTAEPN